MEHTNRMNERYAISLTKAGFNLFVIFEKI